jgi:citrate synthase
MPTLAAFSYRHNMGMPYVYPDNDLNYAGNLLGMLYKMTELKYQPDPRIERALDVLFILHADHEQNCSTSAVRAIGSSLVDPYSAIAGGIAALYGPRTAAPTRRSCGCCTGSARRRTSPTSSPASRPATSG